MSKPKARAWHPHHLTSNKTLFGFDGTLQHDERMIHQTVTRPRLPLQLLRCSLWKHRRRRRCGNGHGAGASEIHKAQNE